MEKKCDFSATLENLRNLFKAQAQEIAGLEQEIKEKAKLVTRLTADNQHLRNQLEEEKEKK